MKTAFIAISVCLVSVLNVRAQTVPVNSLAAAGDTAEVGRTSVKAHEAAAPGVASAPAPAATSKAAPTVMRLKVAPTAFSSGPNGDLFLDARAPYPTFGAQLIAHTDAPDIFAKLGTADASSWLSIVDVNQLELMRVRADGRVGIGTTRSSQPVSALEVSKGTDTTLTITGDGGAGMSFLNFAADAGPWTKSQIGAGKYGGDGGYLTFSTLKGGTLTEEARIDQNGKMGIGTATPLALLQVAGDLRLGTNGTNTDLRIFSETGTFPVIVNGVSYDQINSITPVTVPATGRTHTLLHLKSATVAGQGTNQIDFIVDGNIAAKYQDVAEWVPATGDVRSGTVVVLNRSRSNEVEPSSRAYDTTVAGVVSPQPGLLLGEAGASKAKIATTGRVKVRVDATRHAVNIGDLLVTSDTPGLAMVSEPLDLGGVKIHRPGTLIGKALEPLPNGKGEILVLLSLQ